MNNPNETVFLSHLGFFCLILVLRFHHLEFTETVFIIMALYGYARISTSEQDLTLQTQTLRAAGCEIIRAEKASGSSRTGRSELQLLLEFMVRRFNRFFWERLTMEGDTTHNFYGADQHEFCDKNAIFAVFLT